MIKYFWQLFTEGFRDSSDVRERVTTIVVLVGAVALAALPVLGERVVAPFSASYSWLVPLGVAGLVMARQAYRRDAGQRESLSRLMAAGTDDVDEYLDALPTSEHSILPPTTQLEVARSRLNEVAARAAAGEPGARAKLTRASERLLTVSRKCNASGSRYVADYELVEQSLARAKLALPRVKDPAGAPQVGPA